MAYIQVGRPVAQIDMWFATELAARLGVAGAARRMGMTRGTLAAVIAGLPVAATTDDRVRSTRLRSERKAA